MRAVQVAQTFPGSVAEAEVRWYDTAGWPAWVDGCDRVVGVDGPWPRVGAAVTWESGPAGRGEVTERVAAQQPGTGQTLEVRDASITGRQTVTFTAAPGGVTVTLRLEYRLLRRSPILPIIDLLFIRRAMAQSLERTVSRFGARLPAAEPGAAPGSPAAGGGAA